MSKSAYSAPVPMGWGLPPLTLWERDRARGVETSGPWQDPRILQLALIPAFDFTAGRRMNLAVSIALSHLLSHRRQTLVSLLGITLGVAFFMAVTSLMQGLRRGFHQAARGQLSRMSRSTTNIATRARSPCSKPMPEPPWSCAA